MTEPSREERFAQLARRYARSHPTKSAAQLQSLERQVAALEATAAGDLAELERVRGLRNGYEQQLREDKRCIRCGRPLRNENQPGYSESIGPDCWERESL